MRAKRCLSWAMSSAKRARNWGDFSNSLANMMSGNRSPARRTWSKLCLRRWISSKSIGAGAARPRCIEASGCDQTFIATASILSPRAHVRVKIGNAKGDPKPQNLQFRNNPFADPPHFGRQRMTDTDRERLALELFGELCELPEPQRSGALY